MKLEELTISIKVDTTEADKALEKLKGIVALQDKITKQAERIKELEDNKVITIKCNTNIDVEQLMKEIEFYRKQYTYRPHGL